MQYLKMFDSHSNASKNQFLIIVVLPSITIVNLERPHSTKAMLMRMKREIQNCKWTK